MVGGVPKGAWVSGRCSGTITVHGDTLSGGLPHYLRKQVRWRRRTRGPKFARYVAQPQPCVCMYVCSSYSYQSGRIARCTWPLQPESRSKIPSSESNQLRSTRVEWGLCTGRKKLIRGHICTTKKLHMIVNKK